MFSQIIKIKRESKQNEIVEPLKLILKMGGRGGGGGGVVNYMGDGFRFSFCTDFNFQRFYPSTLF